MPKPIRPVTLLLAVVLFAATLTLLLSGVSAARPAFQDSPLVPSPTSTFTVTPLQTADPGAPTTFPEPDRPQPVETFPALDPPTSVPPPPAAGPTATMSGFLPAPTITNPDDIQSIPLAQPAITSGGIDEPVASPTPRRASNPAVVAGVAILNVLWLICGGSVVIGGIVYIILLARRRSDA